MSYPILKRLNRYGCRKKLADDRPRVKGRFVKSGPEYEAWLAGQYPEVQSLEQNAPMEAMVATAAEIGKMQAQVPQMPQMPQTLLPAGELHGELGGLGAGKKDGSSSLLIDTLPLVEGTPDMGCVDAVEGLPHLLQQENKGAAC